MSSSPATLIRRANVVRTVWPVEPQIALNLYLGSGRAGACFGLHGLMNAEDAPEFRRIGKTHLFHADHFHHGKYGIDHHVPVGRLHWVWDKEPGKPTKYRQELDLLSGRLHTQWAEDASNYDLQVGFSPANRDILLVELRYEGEVPDIVFTPTNTYKTSYDDAISANPNARFRKVMEGVWIGRARPGSADSIVGLRLIAGDECCQVQGGKNLRIQFRKKTGHLVFMLVTGGWPRRAELEAQLHQPAEEATRLTRTFASDWRKHWGKKIPDIAEPQVHSLFVRSVYHLLCSHAPDVRALAPPLGWSGAAWGYGFTHDLAFIHPVFLKLARLPLLAGGAGLEAASIQGGGQKVFTTRRRIRYSCRR